MPSSQDYLDYILEQLSDLEELSSRKMMGEFLLYHRDRLFGGIYDDRLMVKPVPAALRLLPDAPHEPPYPGAKALILVEAVDDRAFLNELVEAMGPELPAPKKRKKAK